jgi:HAE1 family hydrophobic/amphiphilic exporter-1
VVGGLLFSQLITLYITPVVYTYMDALQQRLAHRKAPKASGYPEGAPADARVAEATR